MALITRGSVERVKDSVDMVELVGARTDLRRMGGRFVGLCPFHDERTPSFSVNAEHGLYHCFGCGASGDAISFVRDTEGLDFSEAVEHLAERYGVALEREQEEAGAEEARRRRERLMRLLDRTASFYARYLWDSAEARRAREHLSSRGLRDETLRAFRVGYAPSAWNRVLLAGQRDGYSPEEMVAAGVAQHGRQGGYFDRFRARITFPLADPRGRVLGFGARAVRDSQKPKYLNSSENELYRKGRHLFGIDRARATAARAGRVVVVEGYTDVLALHGAGIEESVAIMGTALTPDQLAELGRAASTVLMALDADASGQEAMLRAARTARERGMELRVVALPEGSDPADLVAADGAPGFERLLERALSVPEYEAERVLSAADLATPRGRDRALEQLRPIVAETPERSVVRDELMRRLAGRLEVPVSYVEPVGGGRPTGTRPASTGGGTAADGAAGARRTAVPSAGGARADATNPGTPGVANGHARAAGSEGGRRAEGHQRGPRDGRVAREDAGAGEGGGFGARAPRSPRGAVATRAERGEQAFLAMCLGQPRLGRELLELVREGHLSRRMRAVHDHLLDHLEDPLAELPNDDELAALVTETAMLAEAEPSSEPVLRLTFLQLDLRRVERELVRAREHRDLERQGQLARERADVKERIDELMGEAD